ncbi:hypothetical protein Pcinc_022736 [Petrolisthes cinctipes]|uniref:C2H2-type domain-containing protein n=1 Tax=Petrolisthes cinctipes TaxID=88211 RepID=A0AAE1KGQ3_PETCI|nr:hypothetical protein Pcinc_022736 [Petrolisthes cinctipes]
MDFKSGPTLEMKKKHRSVSCQTTCDYGGQSSMPVIFCALFSTFGEAATQADIPSRVSVAVSTTETSPLEALKEESTEKIALEQNDLQEEEKHLKEEIENVERGVVSPATPSADDDEDEDDNWHPNSDHQDEDEDIDTDDLLDDAFLNLSPNEDNVKEPENSEFSSDNDDAFWAKMKKLSRTDKKRKRKCKWGYKHIYRNVKYSKDELKVPNDIHNGDTDLENKLPKNASDRGDQAVRTDKKSNSDEYNNISDDWITDSEVDDESVDINLAFKMEQKKNRNPPNTKEKKFVCEVCGKLYSKYYILREHIVRDHKDHEVAKNYPYSCEHCKRLYNGERQLEYHRQQQSGPCEICGIMLKCSGIFWAHRRNHDCTCNVCGKAFLTRNSLNMHTKIKHGEGTVSCPLCPRMFHYKSLMNNHVANAHHPNVKNRHNCTLCDFWAKTEGSLRMHQRRVHNIEPPLYSCSVCQKTFSTKKSHRNHMARHFSKDKFACSVCSETFTTRSALRSHKRAMHGKVTRKRSKRKVMEQQEEVQTFHCSLCSIGLASEEEVSQHMLHCPKKDSNITTIKQEVGSIQLTEMVEHSASIMQINVNDETTEVHTDVGELTEELDAGSGINYSGTRSALLMPASVVPADVNMVDIDGVQYHVLRGNQ